MVGWRKALWYWLAFSIFYFGLAMFSLETRDSWSLSSSVWLPAGLVLGVLCTSQPVYWPLWGMSAGVLHILTSLLYGRSFDVALTFALIDLSVLFPLAIIWRSTCRYPGHHSYRTEVFFLLAGVYTTSIIGGLLSVFILKLLNYPVLISHFSTWALSNATGCLSGASFFIFRRFFREPRHHFNGLQYALLFIVSVIFMLPPELISPILIKQALLYLALGVSLVLTVSLPLNILTVYLLYLTLLINLATLLGYGPLVVNEPQGMQASQLYLLVVVSLGLIFAVYKKENSARHEKLRQQLTLLCHLLENQQPVFFQFSSDTERFRWSGNQSVFGIACQDLPTLLLLQARLHPEDQGAFAEYLSACHGNADDANQYSVRLLLSDQQYHIVRCSIAPDHSELGTIGVLMLKN